MACTLFIRSALLALLLLAAGTAGRPLDAGGSSHRKLAGFPACPAGCKEDGVGCVQDATGGGLRCIACQGTLTVTNAGQCGCMAGRYYSSEYMCSTCPKGSVCPGGPLTEESQPEALECPEGMTTLGVRSVSVTQCVNLPGNFFVPANTTGGTPSAAPCPADTWSRGLRKQRQCVPCFPGFTTGGVTGASSATACFVSAGFYLPPGASAATACPRSTYKSEPGAAAACTACPQGVTTETEGSTSQANCTIVVPGSYATALQGTAVTATKPCPQRFYCPGGVPTAAVDPAQLSALDPSEPTIKACPDNTWTQGQQAASAEECLTPPGFFTANGTTSQCPPATYRAEWVPPDMAEQCVPCGENIKGSPTEEVAVIDPVSQETSYIKVQDSSSGCYIQPGQGLYRTEVAGRRAFIAKNCDENSYGVSQVAYGRTPFPCRECPAGMVTSSDAAAYPNSASFFVDNKDGTRGFVDPKACVTKAGFGYSSRSAEACPKGWYNQKDTWDICKICPYGSTTAGVGEGVTVADCKLAPGFGFHSNQILACPVGTYNDVMRNDSRTPCSACPTGRTTIRDGATSVEDCTACAAGFGGKDCATPCGGADPSYGPPGRALGAECVACSVAQVGYSFAWQRAVDTFAPKPVARLGATSGYECLAEFVQVQDDAWYLSYSGAAADLTATPGVAGTAACAELCKADCQFFTYDYVEKTCYTKTWKAPVLEGAPFIAFKTEASGDVGASSVDQDALQQQQVLTADAGGNNNNSSSSNSNTVRAKALSTGAYVFYQDATAAAIGIQTPAPGAASFKTLGDCLFACDIDNSCAGVVLDSTVDLPARPATCKLVKGDTSPGIFKRSLTRADITRLQPPARLLA